MAEDSEKSGWAEFYNHSPGKIDMDRGVTIRSRDGRRIHMYKRQPGLYLDVLGNEVSGEDAAAVGFPVKEHRKEAAIQKKVQKATADIREASEREEKRIRAEAESVNSEKPIEPKTGLPSLATHFNSRDEPRGTEHFEMEYKGGGLWNVISSATSVILMEKVKVQEAMDGMYQLEVEYSEPTSEVQAAQAS